MGELYNPFPKLPKNIRQIGEKDEVVKLYLEDYVITYLKRLFPTGGQDLRVGLLLGSMEQHDGTPYIFIDGAMEMEGVSTDGEKVEFSEAAWKKAYQSIEEEFPKRTVQGWFLCGVPGCQLSPLNYWKQHSQYFTGKNQLMYLNSGLEGEEAVYVTSEDGFYKLKGHSIYYERNQMMQDYMIRRKDVQRVEAEASDRLTRDFRRRMEDRKVEVTGRRNTISTLGTVCSVLSVVVLAGGIIMFNNYQKMKDMEAALVSALPKVSQKLTGDDQVENYRESAGDVIIEEIPGGVYPTEETGGAQSSGAVDLPVGRPGSGHAGETETIAQESQSEPLAPAATAPAPTAAPESVALETQATANPEPPKQEQPTQGGNATASQSFEDSASANSQGTVYVVGEGETLYGICLKVYHNLNRLDEVCQLNNIEDVNKIISGQKLILP